MKNADMPIHGELKKAGDAAIQQGGLTKREHFAALAMQGLLSNPVLDDFSEDDETNKEIVELVARMSLDAADALLAALDQ